MKLKINFYTFIPVLIVHLLLVICQMYTNKHYHSPFRYES